MSTPLRTDMPNRYMMTVPGMAREEARVVAEEAVRICAQVSPKLSGASSRGFQPVWGEGYFGIFFSHPYVFFQDQGINPFTMRRLAGKTIPMWVNDPTGEVERKNPRAKKRVTADGRRQVLIFRKAAPIGSRKTVIRNGVAVDVPRSYPGAPGRISVREPRDTVRRGTRVGGRIARGNVGVRWRHPGLGKRSFIRYSLVTAAQLHGWPSGPIRDNLGRYR